MRYLHLFTALLLLVILASCASTQNISYFQDIEQSLAKLSATEKKITLKEGDKVAIVVTNGDGKRDNPINLPTTNNNTPINSTLPLMGYTVDSKGIITLPLIGEINALGASQEELTDTIKAKIAAQSGDKEVVVVVEFLNLTVSVLGEVVKPGRYAIDKDKFTILDALGKSGDLTIYGKRENIKLIRTTPTGIKTYRVNLNSLTELYSSPSYYLEQNDVIYVEPNSVKQRQSTLNGNSVRQSSFWVSIISLLTTVSLFLFL